MNDYVLNIFISNDKILKKILKTKTNFNRYNISTGTTNLIETAAYCVRDTDSVSETSSSTHRIAS